MLRIAVLDDYQNVARRYGDFDALGPDCAVDVFHHNLATVDAAAEALAGYDVLGLMRERMALPRELIARLPNLKLVVVTGGRSRTVDLDAAAERGIVVCHTHAGESLSATPELAFGLILSCARFIPEEHARVRAGGWQETIGFTLAGRTLGLLGLGRMGSRMVPIATAFGMEVIAWSQNLTAERAREAGATRVEKAELFGRADIVSIHVPLSPRSRGLVGPAEIAAMKPGALLINTSRGPIVDEPALLAALDDGRIRAGLDVFDVEPLPADHPLRRAPNVVLTPHLGFVTEGAYAAFYRDMVEDIAAWRAGVPVRVLAAGA